jgi:hypothetical protein
MDKADRKVRMAVVRERVAIARGLVNVTSEVPWASEEISGAVKAVLSALSLLDFALIEHGEKLDEREREALRLVP